MCTYDTKTLPDDVVYYEVIKRKLNRRLIHECRQDERLKVNTVGSTRLGYTVDIQEHLVVVVELTIVGLYMLNS